MNVLIAGLTCSGKTTLSNEILNATILREDDYMKDRVDLPNNGRYYLMDLPESYNIDEYVMDTNNLLTNGYTYYPQYNFNGNVRLNKNEIVYKKDINVFEGLHVISALKDLDDSIKVFMDTDINTCLERRINRDTTLYKMDAKLVRKYFIEVILPIYRQYIEYQRDLADVVIRKEDDKKCLLKKLQKNY